MPIPSFTQRIIDGGLGLIDGDASDVCIKLGVSTLGTANVLTFYSDPDLIKTERGVGPVVDSAVYHLEAGNDVVGILNVNASVAGVAGSVAVTRGGPADSTGTMTVSGAPNDGYDVRVQFTKDGLNIAAAAAAFKYSVDGGDTYSAEIALPTSGTYPIFGTGLTVTFVNGGSGTSFKTGDVHAFTCSAPGYSATDVNNALDALRNNYKDAKFGFLHLVGQASTSAGAATIATAVDLKMTAEETAKRYTACFVEWPDESDATILASVANFTSVRVFPVAGFEELVANNKVMKRSAGTVAAARMSRQDIRRDLGRTKPDGEGGPVPGVTKIYRDEGATPALADAGFTTLRTHAGQKGFYLTDGRLRAPAGSDFKFTQYRRLMDRACSLNRDVMFPHLNDDEFRTNDDGTLFELDARNLESEANNALDADLTKKNRVSATRVLVNRKNNIGQTLTLLTKVRVRPKGYAKYIESEIGFESVTLANQ
jgi:hypothetical protein